VSLPVASESRYSDRAEPAERFICHLTTAFSLRPDPEIQRALRQTTAELPLQIPYPDTLNTTQCWCGNKTTGQSGRACHFGLSPERRSACCLSPAIHIQHNTRTFRRPWLLSRRWSHLLPCLFYAIARWLPQWSTGWDPISVGTASFLDLSIMGR